MITKRIGFASSIMCLAAILCVALDACANKGSTTLPGHLQQAGWELVWKDEFDGEKLDDSKWRRCRRGSCDWDNTVSDDPRLLKIEDGVLHLRGIVNDKKDKDPAPYLTAAVTSLGKFAFKYGKVQIRARFQSAQGAWPALWMMSEAFENHPNMDLYAEIDLMEHLNFNHNVYQTVHTKYTKINTTKQGAAAKINRDDWNTYGCEWDADKIVFTVNSKPTHTYPRMPEKGEKQWPFDQPCYFILSMQIGGGWVNGSGPTNPDHYPAGMKIDWVRVYKRKKSAD